MNAHLVRGPWKEEEKESLVSAIRTVLGREDIEGVVEGIDWNAVSAIVKTKNSETCNSYWSVKQQHPCIIFITNWLYIVTFHDIYRNAIMNARTSQFKCSIDQKQELLKV